MKQIFINLLAFGSLLSSVLVITSKNPVIAVIFLISVFINAAGYLILLGIGFIGISYIIVYIGAITVLFLFVIMLINIRLTDITETGSQYTKNIPLAMGISLLFAYEFFTILPFSFNDVSIFSYLLNLINSLNAFILNSDISTANIVFNTSNPVIADTAFANFTQVQAIGLTLYTVGAIWLILVSLILLLAMIAPIFITKKAQNNNISTPFTYFSTSDSSSATGLGKGLGNNSNSNYKELNSKFNIGGDRIRKKILQIFKPYDINRKI